MTALLQLQRKKYTPSAEERFIITRRKEFFDVTTITFFS